MIIRKVCLSLLGLLGLVNAVYDSVELDSGTDHTTYYDDATSTARTMDWLKTSPYDVNLGAQTAGVQDTTQNWYLKDSIVDLGNGVLSGATGSVGVTAGTTTARTVTGSSSANAKTFIEAVRAYHEPNALNAGLTNAANAFDGNQKSWDHIRNFWYRDGDVFALMLDDNANDMMRQGGDSNLVYDIVSGLDANGNVEFATVAEDHHMEYLRNFCLTMGGELWAPSSQAEHDDLLERSTGVCTNHDQVWENGAPYHVPITKTEIYLNLHREGYLECPAGATGVTTNCITKYDVGTPDRALSASTTADEVSSFYTTDRNFGNKDPQTGEFDFCTYNSLVHYYSQFLSAQPLGSACLTKLANNPIGTPYIAEECWTSPSLMRFQKFISQDVNIINTVLLTQQSNMQRQKDCVVSTCNGNSDTGIPSDVRRHSEWNMDHCNLQLHVGICRIRAFGCNAPQYACKSGYTETCNERAAYTQTYQPWINADVANAAAALGGSVDTNSAQLDIFGAGTPVDNVIVVDDTAAQNIINGATLPVAISPPNVQVKQDNPSPQLQASYDSLTGCTCTCASDDYNTFLAAVAVQPAPVSFDAQVSPAPTNVLGQTQTWVCGDTNSNNCYTNSYTATCEMGHSYDAGWFWTSSTPDISACTKTCCEDYNDSSNVNAAYDTTNGALDVGSFHPGDTYTAKCNSGFHVQGQPDSVVDKTFTVGALGNCFEYLTCEPASCHTCPTLANGYCYNTADLSSVATTWPATTQLRCRCNRCYALAGAASDLPFEDTTCSAPSWSAIQGTCVPLKCGNHIDVANAMPIEPSAVLCGESITYQCNEGYEALNGVAPTSLCNSDISPLTNSAQDNTGNQGFFDTPVGSCVPVMCRSRPDSQENAWEPVFDRRLNNCKGTVGLHSGSFSADYNIDNSVSITATSWVLETEAFFECYDDFKAVQTANFKTDAQNGVYEVGCAAGTDADCRTKLTAELFTDHAVDTNVPTLTGADIIVSYCKNGAWTTPSHKCVCTDKYDKDAEALKVIRQNYFTYDCTANSVQSARAGSMTHRFLYSATSILPIVFLVN